MRRRIGVAAALVGLAVSVCPDTAVGQRDPDQAVAIVSALQGSASTTPPGRAALAQVRLFDWLFSGSVVQMGRESRLTLAFRNGERVSLAAGTRAKITPTGVSVLSGAVTALPPLPALPVWSVSLGKAEVTSKGAAIRVRGEGITDLYPAAGVSVLAGQTVLRFASRGAAAAQRVWIEDDAGVVVFQAAVTGADVPVPPACLSPGRRYRWVLDIPSQGTRREATFGALPVELAAMRASFRDATAANLDETLVWLGVRLDIDLGLLWEAREGLVAASRKADVGEAAQVLRDELQRRLGATFGTWPK